MQLHRALSDLPDFRNAVVTIGSYDGVHAGHAKILARLRQRAAELDGETVVVTFDPHPRLFFKPDLKDFHLITTLEEKAAALDAQGIDHLVVVPFDEAFSNQSAAQYIEEFLLDTLKAKHVVVGYDHRFGKDRAGDFGFLQKKARELGFMAEQISKHEENEIAVSSTAIRKAIQTGNLYEAKQLLGRWFSFSGTVIVGKQVGRTMGFPTANIQVDETHKLLPKDGIYAAKIQIEGTQRHYDAMLYIGSRPTLDDNRGRSIEANILDFNGNIYNEKLQVTPVAFIREDAALRDLNALKNQIAADKDQIVQALKKLDFSLKSEGKTAENADFSKKHESKAVGQQTEITHKTSQKTWATKLRAAVVILNYNTRDQLLEYLPNVIEHSDGAEIIVADNASPDDSVAVMKQHFPQIRLIELQENHGFSGGYNEALKRVEADVYILLNSDVKVAPNWLDAPLNLMAEKQNVAVVQPKVLALQNPTHFEHAGAAGGWMDAIAYAFCRGRILTHTEEDNGQYDSTIECFWAAGAAYFVRAELYHIFEGFDVDFFAHYEEIDLCWRLKNAGYQIYCTPESVVYHLGGGTLGYESPRKVFLNFRNSLFSIVKNDFRWGVLWKIPTRLLLDGAAGVRYLMLGEFQSILAILKAHFSFYKQFSKYLKKRRHTQQLVEKHRIAPPSRTGIYRGSIVWMRYVRMVKEFGKLK